MIFPKELQAFLDRKTELLRVFKSGPGTQALIAQTLVSRGENVVFVVPGLSELHEMRALVSLLAGEDDGPTWERSWLWLPPIPRAEPTAADWALRWPVLHALGLGDRPRGLIISADNLLAKWPSREVLDVAPLKLATGEEMAPELLLEHFVAWGYRREGMVTSPGEMSVRGDIFDIFAPGYDWPLRIEFFGDTIESIRLFDSATQRSKQELREAQLLPVAPGLTSGNFPQEAFASWDHLKTTGQITDACRQHLRRLTEQGGGFVFPGLYYPKAPGLKSFFPRDPVYLLSGTSQLRSRVEESQWAWQEYLDAFKAQHGFGLPVSSLLVHEAEARKSWTGGRQVLFEDLVLGQKKEGLDLPEKELESFFDLFWKPEEKSRPLSTLFASLAKWRLEASQTLLSFHTERSRKKFLDLAVEEGLDIAPGYALDARGVFARVSPLKKGHDLSWCGVRILPEEILQPQKAQAARPREKTFTGLARFDDLREGELLVHRDYGVARFGGLNRLKIGDVPNDYLLLFFDGEDKLYLPVDRMNLVQRFQGPEGAEPSLDSLRGARWRMTKERAKKAVEKIAQELVQMYAWRKVAKGYAYSPPSELYHEFEATFGWEETPDQARAIQDVLDDMQRAEPMDRLVCGDVGFGKTEVAMRAAFRAVLDGKQVALLCPTTVLAEQHYLNFKNRMQGFPVNIGMLSRFVPAAKQKQTLKAAERGQLDILIGTHRMLSKDVSLPNLGLLVLDEEQRFGVKHKERLKDLKKNVDCLTLTATPIPRTLQLSLSGIRSLSVIETPPADRKAVDTAILERDPETLKKILLRELEREGQVFWVHNRVKTLDSVTEFVRSLVPDARVGHAHGQMSERDLEDTMHKFWHRELDVLVCTAIVESGLDFPNANTLIVDQAQMFGLGQLYQLRGRVGRSDRQAYAYFVVPSLDNMPDVARKRLQVILDLDYLGAGFQVAMEDLKLRGAGNILGEVQSGQIARIGLDLFLEMLEEEVARQKGQPRQEVVEPEVNFVFPAHIPESYVPDSRDRLRYYKALASARDREALAETAGEIRDRFGPLPPELESFLAVVRLKKTLAGLRVVRADLFPGRALLVFDDKAPAVTPQRLIAWLQTRQAWARALPPAKLELRVSDPGGIPAEIARVEAEIGELVSAPDEERGA